MKLRKMPMQPLGNGAEPLQAEAGCCGCGELFIVEQDEVNILIIGPVNEGARETELWGILCHRCAKKSTGSHEYCFD